MLEVSDITDFSVDNFIDDLCSVSLKMHKEYNYPDIFVFHPFPNEKTMLESIKKYNQVWSIRQHTNLNIAS